MSEPPTPLLPSTPHPERAESIMSVDEEGTTPRHGSYFGPGAEGSRGPSDLRPTRSGNLPSPGLHGPAASSSGFPRSSRPTLNVRSDGTRSATISRSASRVRLREKDRDIKDAGYAEDNEDDELNVVDRGEDLIRRRLKERKRAKRERERERRLAEAEAAVEAGEVPEETEELDDASIPPTPIGGAPSGGGSGSLVAPIIGTGLAMSPVRGLPRASSTARARAPSAARVSSGVYPSRHGSVDEGDRASRRGRLRTESVASSSQPPPGAPRHRAESGTSSRPEVPEDAATIAGADDGDDLDEEGTVDDDEEEDEQVGDDDEDDDSPGDEEVTVKDRQDAINIEHPFGLPIWKPALYRKSRSVTRNAESALHSMPSAAAERHLLPGNLLWTILFGWWLSITVGIVALMVTAVEITCGHGGYGKTLRGLAWYIWWPFGKFVEGEGAPDEVESKEEEEQLHQSHHHHDEETGYGATDTARRALSESTSSTTTVRADGSPPGGLPDEPHTPKTAAGNNREPRAAVSFAPGVKSPSSMHDEHMPLLREACQFRKPVHRRAKFLGSLFYWPALLLIVGPVMLCVCIICWFLVITIPMAKLTWELLVLLWTRPLEISFRSAPKVAVNAAPPQNGDSNGNGTGGSLENGDGSETPVDPPSVVLRRQRLQAGQLAPTAGAASTVLLCTYRAVGLQYYKYTVGGVNIMFINLMPIVFAAIIDGNFILPMVERAHKEGRPVSPFLNAIASQALIFVLGLASVIPLSYFIGMAVASISAQSSIGMGAVINATFGSIIEIVLYGIALSQGKGRLVEGSIVGSILAGVLLMPGASMCSGALKRKEQKFNAKSAGVTSTMLIMAIIGTLTPTLFYQTYGSFEIHCDGCPAMPDGTPMSPDKSWQCQHCYYEHPDPVTDPFYQDQVKTLMYLCAIILVLSYLIGLWFSLRTHASQIWQNPQQLMNKEELPTVPRVLTRITPSALNNPVLPIHTRPESVRDGLTSRHGATPRGSSPHLSPANKSKSPLSASRIPADGQATFASAPPTASASRNVSSGGQVPSQHTGYTPFLESFDRGGKTPALDSLPPALTSEDLRRAVHTLATVSAMHQGSKPKAVEEDHEEGGGHEAPSWTRGVSAAVLLSCTLLYALIAEVLVDVVDVVLHGSGIDEKVLGLTLFALVPNTTEFMNAMSFAMNGNIMLSMEIGSAYALQVCLLQIPAMVAFSAIWNPSKLGDQIDTFTLIFPRWDVIAIILSIFLLTYTYIEARANYHRGSILILAYVVLMMGFYFAPNHSDEKPDTGGVRWEGGLVAEVSSSLSLAVTKIWL